MRTLVAAALAAALASPAAFAAPGCRSLVTDVPNDTTFNGVKVSEPAVDLRAVDVGATRDSLVVVVTVLDVDAATTTAPVGHGWRADLTIGSLPAQARYFVTGGRTYSQLWLYPENGTARTVDGPEVTVDTARNTIRFEVPLARIAAWSDPLRRGDRVTVREAWTHDDVLSSETSSVFTSIYDRSSAGTWKVGSRSCV